MDEKLSHAELAARLATVQATAPVGSQWQHYKGGHYAIVGHAILEATQDAAIIYRPLAHPDVPFIRALSVWQESVEWNGRVLPRFSRLV